jgi:COMPASS component SWD1
LQWHPSQPLVIAAGLDSGTIYQWSTTVAEGWSAFAPDFVELDENRVYEEREDEFDIVFFHFLPC